MTMFSGLGCSYHGSFKEYTITGTHPDHNSSSDMEGENRQEEDKRTRLINCIQDSTSRDKEWLRLGVGRQTEISRKNTRHLDRTAENRRGFLELNLFSGRAEGSGASSPHAPPMLTNGGLNNQSEASVGPYNFRRPNNNSNGTRIFTSPYHNNNLGRGGDVAAGQSLSFRVIERPRSTHSSSIWFYLQALQNQANEPFLPQVTKSYLRIKDGRMTVRLLKKYLAKKLHLDNESEIGIECRGHEVEALMTIEHVRDRIWSRKESTSVTLLPNSISDHVMILHYGRI